ncbi:fructose-1,6-bisphosphatase [Cellulosilyticum lentocellum]|uniref:Fructose-1,6-bisphosphatase class 3 n=1 Tax=Cellulosilyticum lentocellum (strain ATCC 49066 / DSM 5427 / NCIMB 11756 / RHM5) TaxID=642492 RepID=F2JMP5_CELLD|nr:fructose-1,6-bisphosphatase [Cellulosilyticum lentocellum]ADZ84696.1 Fructose-bisphosphatase [Cellulosilyticum lentocellum DSM 5427]
MEAEEINLKLLKFLAKQYPTMDHAITEMINLQAILNLPKATEHFVSDIHGEYEAFSHVLRNASGVLKTRIDELFINEMSDKERRAFAILIYYPEKKMKQVADIEEEMNEWYRINLLRVIRLCKVISSKYTRSKVRKALPKEFAYIMEELLNEQVDTPNKEQYYYEIVDRIISLNKAEAFMCAFCHLIQRLAIGHLHVLGDIFDRGPRADKVMDILQQYHSVDIQWGNHDILWMGAASGSGACIANIIRNACKYSNLETLEDGYGINLLPLATFALDQYKDQDYSLFMPVIDNEWDTKQDDVRLVALMHMAITFIQFKLEHQLIEKCFDKEMKNRDLLGKINYEEYTITIDGMTHQLNADVFKGINPKAPYDLSKEEIEVIDRLRSSFLQSSKLQEHIQFMFTNGSMYKVYNNNLLYHGCILLTEEGTFKQIQLDGKYYSGKAYLERLEAIVREGYFNVLDKEAKQKGMDIMWYLWCGSNSPVFGKQKMTTFERYFIQNEETWKEPKNSYYEYLDDEEMAMRLLMEFGINSEEGHIINGHVPVQVKKGEKPIKAGGKIIVIDGGFTKAYQKITGIAGYTLIYNSFGLQLASHEPFEGVEEAITSEKDMVTSMNVIEYIPTRKRVKDTDIGKDIDGQIKALLTLVEYYQLGLLKTKES